MDSSHKPDIQQDAKHPFHTTLIKKYLSQWNPSNWPEQSSRKLAFLTALFSFMLLSSLSVFFIHLNYQTQTDYLTEQTQKLKRSLTSSIEHALHQSAKTLFDTSIDIKSINKLMAEAKHGATSIQDEKRQQLYRYLLPLYQRLIKDNVRQIHFHLPGAISFLRMHRPSKYGDDLSKVRYSIQYVNQTQKIAAGFEEGRIFNGYRSVFPIHYRGEFVGTVEISYSYNAIFNLIDDSHNEYNTVLLNRNLIENKLFNNELGNYQVSNLSPDLLEDSVLKNFNLQNTSTIKSSTLNAINQQIRSQFLTKQQRQCENCSFITRVNDDSYLVLFNRLNNIQNNAVGFIVHYIKEPVFDRFRRNFWQRTLLNEALLLALSVLLFFVIRNQIDRKRLLQKMAQTDHLTGISNRSRFKQALNEQIEKTQHKHSPLSMIFLDLDHFKQINDNYGHLVGDSVLKHLSQLIQNGINLNGIFARWGGEEFVLLLPKTDLDTAAKIAEQLRKTVENQNKFDFTITCSFGVSCFQKHDTAHSFMNRVDNLLYSSKEHGRNRVTVHDKNS